MIRPLAVFLLVALLSACENTAPAYLPGLYRSHGQWNGNDIRIKLREDSVFTFTAFSDAPIKGAIYCSAGTWTTSDSFLVLKGFPQEKRYHFPDYFPELKDSQQVTPLLIDAKFIIRGEKLYNLDDKGARANEQQYYDKTGPAGK